MEQDLAELSLFDLERLLAIKRYFLSSASTPEDLIRLQREVDAIETRIVLKKVEMGVHSGDEDEKEEVYYNEDEGHDSDSSYRESSALVQRIQLQPIAISETNPFESEEEEEEDLKVFAEDKPFIRFVPLERGNLVNFEDSSISQVGCVVFAEEEDSKETKFLLAQQKLSSGVRSLFDRLSTFVSMGAAESTKEGIRDALTVLSPEEKVVVKHILGKQQLSVLRKVIEPQWDRGIVHTLQMEYESDLLKNWQQSTPWQLQKRKKLPSVSVLSDSSVWETANLTLKEHTGLSLYDSSMQCVQLLQLGHTLFFVFRFVGMASELKEKIEQDAGSRRFIASLDTFDSALQQIAFQPDQVKILTKVGQVLGISSSQGGKGGYHLGMLLAAIVPLFQKSPVHNPFHSLLPEQLAEALRRHEEAQSSKDRSTLTKLTDPGESLFSFFKELNQLEPALYEKLKTETLKIKGFTEGKVTQDAAKAIIRGDDEARAVVYLAVNSDTGMEFVGTSYQPLWKRVCTLFKEALITNPTKEYSETNRELHQAIRTSKLRDWRVVILEQGVLAESFAEKERYFVSNYNTFWPGGYN